MTATVRSCHQLLSQVLCSLYTDQPVKVVPVENDHLLVEAYGHRRVFQLQATDSFEVVFEQLVRWIELCLAYSLSPNPKLLRLIQKALHPSSLTSDGCFKSGMGTTKGLGSQEL